MEGSHTKAPIRQEETGTHQLDQMEQKGVAQLNELGKKHQKHAFQQQECWQTCLTSRERENTLRLLLKLDKTLCLWDSKVYTARQNPTLYVVCKIVVSMNLRNSTPVQVRFGPTPVPVPFGLVPVAVRFGNCIRSIRKLPAMGIGVWNNQVYTAELINFSAVYPSVDEDFTGCAKFSGTLVVRVHELDGTLSRRFPCSHISSYPCSLTVTEGCVFVADIETRRIFAYKASDGAFLFSWGSRGREIYQFASIDDLCASKSLVYVCDGANNRICVFDSNGIWNREIGCQNPYLISVSNETIAVLHDRTASIFTVDGSLIRTWDNLSTFIFVRALVASDRWIALCVDTQIHVFGLDGHYIHSTPTICSSPDAVSTMCLNEFVTPPLHRNLTMNKFFWTKRYVEVDSGLREVDRFSDDLIDIVLSYVGDGGTLFGTTYECEEFVSIT
jgi:hypothetical protein